MSSTALPSPELYEPYENYKYAALRHELSVRKIHLPRSVQRLNDQEGFIQLLRDWDQTQNSGTSRPVLRRVSPRRSLGDNKLNHLTSSRAIRTRRGCRFRLINVLLNPKFSRRWAEMISRGRNTEVNRFWSEVHVAYTAKNSSFDTLQYQDALFVNVTPNIILAHSAARLQQMWVEIVVMYRNAVAQSKKAAAKNDTVHSFFDFCAGRLDLLYLHMAMVLEPKLFKFVLSVQLPAASEPFSKSKPKTVAPDAESAQAAGSSKSSPLVEAQAATASSSKPVTKTKVTIAASSKAGAMIEPTAATVANSITSTLVGAEDAIKICSKPDALTDAQAATTAHSKLIEKMGAEAATTFSLIPDAVPGAAFAAVPKLDAVIDAAPGKAREVASGPATTEPPAPPKLSGVLTQNPEMDEFSTFADTANVKSKLTLVEDKSGFIVKHSKPAASLYTASVPKKIKKSAGKGKAAATATLSKEAKSKYVPSRKKQSTASAKSKAVSNPTYSIGNHFAQRTVQRKRPRAEEETAIIQVSTTSDIVPHSKKRANSTTTLETRPTDVVLPPDEWDILENRLRKVNDNIDRCHRGLSSMEVNMSDSYKQSLEADLRFYSAIKQRLQEQLLVVMQSGY